jgi:hypothetical protein
MGKHGHAKASMRAHPDGPFGFALDADQLTTVKLKERLPRSIPPARQAPFSIFLPLLPNMLTRLATP